MRHTRYQGAIVEDGKMLLITHKNREDGREYWVIPGGGREDGESEEECVIREMKEETHLDVEVLSLAMDEAAGPDGVYKRRKTFLCKVVGGEAAPGHEPELEASERYSISAVAWFDLSDEASWGDKVKADPFTYPQMMKLQKVLGYEAN